VGVADPTTGESKFGFDLKFKNVGSSNSNEAQLNNLGAYNYELKLGEMEVIGSSLINLEMG